MFEFLKKNETPQTDEHDGDSSTLIVDKSAGNNDDDNVTPVQQERPRPFSTYDYILDYMKDKGVGEEDRKRVEKRNKTNSIIAGIADVGSALSNLYYTTKGAPDAYDPKNGMSAKAQERYDKAMADFDKNRAWHLNYAMHMANANAADEQRKQQTALAEQRLQAQQASAEERREAQQRKEREKELDAVAADWANQHGYATMAAEGKLDTAAEEESVDVALAAGDIKEDEAKRIKRKLYAIKSAADEARARRESYKQIDSKYRSTGGGGGRGGNYHEFVAGYRINKNDYVSAINEGYAKIPQRYRLPEFDALGKPKKYSRDELHRAIEGFLSNPNISDVEKKPLRDKLESIKNRSSNVSARPEQQQAAKQGNGKAPNNWNDGKKTNKPKNW